ncbi:MAG: OmpH family outer membrane protein [Bacteroidetes bacterium]|nr:OmpH family outer membrane protein [Bacteroidota bacterium]
MKNLSLFLNIVLLAAVAYLFFDKFSGPKKAATPAATEQKLEKPLRVVHVNIDTLHERSLSYQAIKAQLEKKYADAEASMKVKENVFQKELKEYQAKMQSGSITPNQAQQYEESLGKKQKSIVDLQEKVGQELKDETDKFDEKFVGDVKHYADSLKQANGYDYVLLYGGIISPMLAVNDSLDITQAIVDLLNKKK